MDCGKISLWGAVAGKNAGKVCGILGGNATNQMDSCFNEGSGATIALLGGVVVLQA